MEQAVEVSGQSEGVEQGAVLLQTKVGVGQRWS